jgi:hypothetical protein
MRLLLAWSSYVGGEPMDAKAALETRALQRFPHGIGRMVDDAEVGGQGGVGASVAVFQVFQQRPIDVEGAGEIGL